MGPRKAAEAEQRNQGNTRQGCYLPFGRGREREKETGGGDQQENKCRGQTLGWGSWGEEPRWLQFLLKDHLQQSYMFCTETVSGAFNPDCSLAQPAIAAGRPARDPGLDRLVT